MTENPKRNPAHRLPDWCITMPMAHATPRCGARTRPGMTCKGPAMPNGRCRMHGGSVTGLRTAEGLQHIVKARTVHGAYGAEMRELRKLMRGPRASAKRLVEMT
jgi:hypothetical protein